MDANGMWLHLNAREGPRGHSTLAEFFDEQPNATDQLKVCRLNSNNNPNSMETYWIGGWALVPDHARPIHWIKKDKDYNAKSSYFGF